MTIQRIRSSEAQASAERWPLTVDSRIPTYSGKFYHSPARSSQLRDNNRQRQCGMVKLQERWSLNISRLRGFHWSSTSRSDVTKQPWLSDRKSTRLNSSHSQISYA